MTRLNVLVACESSGTVREAFNKLGHNAWSCDLLEADDGSTRHFTGDVFDVLDTCGDWDIVIAHPPCTYLCVAGNRWHAGSEEREEAITWTMALAQTFKQRGYRWAIENPVGVLSTQWRKPDQYIQPWQFGHGETKKTGLWLGGLAPLEVTNVVDGREQRIWRMGPSPDRWKLRSKTYQGIADAMAWQWGGYA